ncbi:MAG: dipeptidyl aminopeptidase/acylaminoacyl-peptidase [Chlorobi bacterium OLB4]|jgi:Dipeptidyl aminopeptidases/acylaminoacyl-peptidases|nr:MAG: dipeptidyl aminopeptidase/acylaminoacyl-peptidase [Chlorobi bacterium OLB4]MBW7854848.1 S9 family peptidase [Ignavibacteria bacterium]OQY78429.1 MAG: hypothetical protein B6D43_02885 [Ignavibacteriales bacterium UTCHB1]
MSKKKTTSVAVKQFSVEQFFSIRSIYGFKLSHDSKTVFYITNTTGTPQIWSVPIIGGAPKQISVWNDSVKAIYQNPKSPELIFLSDYNGNENLQIYKIPSDGGEVTHVAGDNQSQTMFVGFNKGGTKILYSTNRKLSYNFETFVHDLKTGKEKRVYGFDDPTATIAEEWSDNSRYITFVKMYGNINTDLLLYDTTSRKLKNITGHDLSVDTFNAGSEFDNKNRGFYFVSDEGRDFKGIKYYDIKKATSNWVVKHHWDVANFVLSDDNSFMIYTLNRNGNLSPYMLNLKTGKSSKLNLPKGNYSSLKITKDGKKLVYVFESPLNPADIFTYDFKSGKITQLTDSLIGGLGKEGFTVGKDIFYRSFDGKKIHAILYIPRGTKKNGSNPAIIWPHGGPEWQEVHNFSKYIQVLTNSGYIVIAPNFRGSTGYGKKFQKLIYKDWGGAEFKDVLGAYDYLCSSGFVNRKKIAVVGGSFGGFMTLTCVTKAPERWRCAVDIFGPSNLITFVNSVPEHWKSGTDILVGNPVRDKGLLEERSPINFVDKIECPMLVIQGRHDPRVVEAESGQIVKKLKSSGKDVDYILLEDEGHGFSKVSNQIKVFKAKLEFLNKHLRSNKSK